VDELAILPNGKIAFCHNWKVKMAKETDDLMG